MKKRTFVRMTNFLSNINNQTVIVSPLDWGLGHATRCIPIVKQLKENGNTCVIASSGNALTLLRREFPNEIFEELPAYNIIYGKTSFTTLCKLLFQIPKALRVKKEEYDAIDKIVKKYDITTIISDNRFGVRNTSCKNIFITHQLRIRLPFAVRWLEKLFFLANKSIIAKYDECWIPDYEGEKNLSGLLSHSWEIPHTKFIGPLSAKERVDCAKQCDIAVILSGPEPQKGIFEKELHSALEQYQVKDSGIKYLMERNLHSILITSPYKIAFINSCGEYIDNQSIIHFSHQLTNEEVSSIICKSKVVISRAGYSSIMDYEKLGCKAILVPTPGQSEQEYLASYLAQKEQYQFVSQKNLKKELISLLKKYL